MNGTQQLNMEGYTAMRWDELVGRVRECGQYATEAEARTVTRTVLSALGGHVTGEERAELARALPQEAARVLVDRIPALRPLAAPEFVDGVAARLESATPATARWDVSSVLYVVGGLAGDSLLTRLLEHLPPGYALLFGRAELAPPDRPLRGTTPAAAATREEAPAAAPAKAPVAAPVGSGSAGAVAAA